MRIRDLLFERSGGHWLFWLSAIYLVIALPCALYYKEIETPFFQIGWLIGLSLPLIVPPLGRWLNMSVEWDRNMKWFGKKDKESNVVKFPEPKAVPPVPETTPPKEEPAKVYYRLGLTDNNRVSFSMYYNEITMSSGGVQQMIDQLEFFKSQLHEESEQ